MANQTDNSLIIKVSLDTKGSQKSLDGIKNNASTTGEAIGRDLGKGFSKSFIASIGKVGAALAALGGARKVASSFIDLENSIGEVNTIASNLGKTNQELAKQFIDLSSQFGGTAADQAKAFYQIISAGVTDARKANELLIASNKLAIGGLSDQAGAIDILTTAVNAFSDKNLSASRAADILFGTVKLGKTRISELSASLGQILPSSDALGISFEETAGAIAQLTTRGISTSEAVTSLNGVFTAMLKKQAIAASLGPKVAAAFSLQAAKTKGLSKFLLDLNDALGGSKTKLIQLTGRAEAARAIISLAGDKFKGLTDKINELKGQTGSADKAFQTINETLGRQLVLAGSKLLAIFTKVAELFNTQFVSSFKSLNSVLDFINKNFESLVSTLFQLGRVALETAIILNAGLITDTLLVNFAALRTIVLATSQTFRFNFSAALLLGKGRLKAFVLALKETTIATKLLTLSIKLFKAALTFGVLLVVDQLISKFVELRAQGASFGQTMNVLAKNIELGFLFALRNVVEFLTINMPKALSFFGINGVQTFEDINRKIISTKQELKGLFTAFNPKKPVAEKLVKQFDDASQKISTQSITIFDTLSNSFNGFKDLISSAFSDFFDQISNVVKLTDQQLTQLANGFGQTFAGGISKAVQSTVTAIQKGQNAFEALGKSILGIIGDLAIFVGQFVVATGIAKIALQALPGGAAIAAGLGLIALGTLLKNLSSSSFVSGGGGGGGASTNGGGAPTTTPGQDVIQPKETLQKQTAVTVNVEGTVLDPVGVGQQIASILDETFNAGASTIQVNSA